MAIGDVWRLSAVGTWAGGNTAVITVHYRLISAGASFDTAAADWRSFILNAIRGAQSSAFTWNTINGITRNVTPPMSGTFTTGLPLAGTQAGDALPNMDSVVVTLRTLYAGRSYRGRNYIPGFSEATQNSGVLAAAQVTAIQDAYDLMLASNGYGGSSTDFRVGVWSQKLQSFSDVTSAVVRANMGTQRRRRPGVGI